VFRCLVVAAGRNDVNVDDPAAIDAFLSDDASVELCVQFVKDVYHMEKDKRDALLYTNEVSKNSARFGARPLCQAFKDGLLEKWLADAANEGFEVVLLDGRALEEVGQMLESKGLCDFALGLYFTCEPTIAARRTLGYASVAYADLTDTQRADVDQLVVEINARNDSDKNRNVHPVIPPVNGVRITLPELPVLEPPSTQERSMFIIDTSAEMTKNAMTAPVKSLVALRLAKR